MSEIGRSLRIDPSTTNRLGVGAEAQRTIQEHWDTYDKAEGAIITLGLGELHQPDNECPHLTADMLNEPDSNKYSDNQQWFSSWLNFTTELLARIDAQVLQYRNMLVVLTAETKKGYRERNAEERASDKRTKKLSIDEINQKMYSTTEYQTITHALQQLEQKRLMLKARVETLSNDVKLLSRRIELTKIDVSAQRAVSGADSRFRSPVTG